MFKLRSSKQLAIETQAAEERIKELEHYGLQATAAISPRTDSPGIMDIIWPDQGVWCVDWGHTVDAIADMSLPGNDQKNLARELGVVLEADFSSTGGLVEFLGKLKHGKRCSDAFLKRELAMLKMGKR